MARTSSAPERQRIRNLLQRASVAMLVTTDLHGAHAGRPMLPLFLPDDPHIYFLTHHDSRKVRQMLNARESSSRSSARGGISLRWGLRLRRETSS